MAASFAPQMFTRSSQMRFVMMFGFSASCWAAAMAASLDWKVNSVAVKRLVVEVTGYTGWGWGDIPGRPFLPPSKLIVGLQEPKPSVPVPVFAVLFPALPTSMLSSAPSLLVVVAFPALLVLLLASLFHHRCQ